MGKSHGLPESHLVCRRPLLLVGCMNNPVRLMRLPVSKYPLFKTRRKVSLWKQLPDGEVPMGAAAESMQAGQQNLKAGKKITSAQVLEL